MKDITVRRSSRGVVAYVLDFDIVVSEFEIQSCQYVPFRSNVPRKGMNPSLQVWVKYHHPGDLGSIPGRVIPKTLKMELDTTLLNTQHYKVRFKGKVEQSWEWSSALPYTLV